MEALPYFLLLLKKNLLLCSIISTSSFASLDLSQIDHRVHSEQAIDFRNFKLGEDEVFPLVTVIMVESGITITFHTNDSKYYDHPEVYFKSAGLEKNSDAYSIGGMRVQTRKKTLGKFVIFDKNIPSASVVVRHSNLYGYVIAISFYTHNLLEPKH